MAIPLTIGYLGIERYGAFVSITALTSLFAFADLGLGNGLLNVVSDANGRDDRIGAARAVSSAVVMLTLVAIALAGLLAFAFPAVDWAAFLNVTTPAAAQEVGATVAVLLVVFLLGLPLGVAERIRLAYQEGFINSLATMSGAIVSVAALIAAIALHASLPVLVLAVTAPSLLALLVNALDLLRRRPWLRPRLALADRRAAIRLARLGFLFFILQLAVAVAYQSDVVVAGAVIGPQAAATYAVTLKFFMIVPMLVGLFLLPLWPAYTEALTRHDGAWVLRMLRRSVLIAVVCTGAGSLVLYAVGAAIIRIWTNGAIEPPPELLLGAAIWAVVSTGFNAIAMLLNAASVVLFQVVTASVMAVASLVLSIALANTVGISGIIWGTLVAYLLFSAIPICLYLPGFLKRIGAVAPVAGGGSDA